MSLCMLELLSNEDKTDIFVPKAIVLFFLKLFSSLVGRNIYIFFHDFPLFEILPVPEHVLAA